MATVEATATAVRTIDDEREQLLSFGMPELRVIAEEIGAESARSRVQLVENILAKKTGEAAEVLEEEEALDATEIEADAQADAAREAIAADNPEEIEAP